MNLPALLPVLERQGIENPIVCSNINKIGFRMCGGAAAYEAALRERRVPRGRDVGLRVGAIPAREAIEWVCAQPNVRIDRLRRLERTQHCEHPRVGDRALGGAQLSTLLVASTGGHLKQLHRLHRRLVGIDGPYRWATFDTPQSRSLLDGEEVDYVRFVGGRDPVNLLSNLPAAHRILSDRDIDAVVSTGSSMALPFFALARARGRECHYIESAARSEGPSATGRAMSRIPGVWLYSQYPLWARDRWRHRGSVFDSFAPIGSAERRSNRLSRVVVTLGTYRGFGFPRLVRRLLAILPADAEVLWQTGDTDTGGLGVEGHRAIPERDLSQAMHEADVVVAHAGRWSRDRRARGRQMPGPGSPSPRPG